MITDLETHSKESRHIFPSHNVSPIVHEISGDEERGAKIQLFNNEATTVICDFTASSIKRQNDEPVVNFDSARFTRKVT